MQKLNIVGVVRKDHWSTCGVEKNAYAHGHCLIRQDRPVPIQQWINDAANEVSWARWQDLSFGVEVVNAAFSHESDANELRAYGIGPFGIEKEAH
ncbi:hypothetical protein [Xanthomonas vasicola]|uniref:hypothetical protein n=1 Tax=Xanthomonas vasicola TaxID=56459 RepID=UPI000A4AFA7B